MLTATVEGEESITATGSEAASATVDPTRWDDAEAFRLTSEAAGDDSWPTPLWEGAYVHPARPLELLRDDPDHAVAVARFEFTVETGDLEWSWTVRLRLFGDARPEPLDVTSIYDDGVRIVLARGSVQREAPLADVGLDEPPDDRHAAALRSPSENH